MEATAFTFCLSVFVGVFFACVLFAVVGLDLIDLIDVEGAQGDGDDEAEPAVVEEVVAGHACDEAEEHDDDHVDFDFH